MKLKAAAWATALLVCGTANAQSSWFTDFENTLNPQGTFASQSGGALVFSSLADWVLSMGASETASFTFTTTNAAQYFLLEFWTSSPALGGGGSVTATIGAPDRSKAFIVPQAANPNPHGAFYSWHLGDVLNPWAPGTYTLTFDNAPSGGFRLDDVKVSAVPEPSVYALAVAGLVALGLVSRRRRQG